MSAGRGGRVEWLDAFGTRLHTDEVMAALAGFGVPSLHLVVADDHVRLEVDGAEVGGDAVSRAVTWVRGAFSPLLPCDVVVVPGLAPGVSWTDLRRRLPEVVAMVEIVDLPGGLRAGLDELLRRLGSAEAPGGWRDGAATGARQGAGTPGRLRAAVGEGEAADRLAWLAATASEALVAAGESVDTSTLGWLDAGTLARSGPAAMGAGPHLIAWQRPGGPTGVRPALIVAATRSAAALDWLVAALADPPDRLPDVPVLLDGLCWELGRRPTVAAAPASVGVSRDTTRCPGCAACASDLEAVGPSLGAGGYDRITALDAVDACPNDALRPTYSAMSAARGDLPAIGDGWLARLRGAPGPAEPNPFPPSYLLPKDGPVRVVLGLAVMTQQEHAAALIIDGVLVGALEEEKVVRVRHYGWTPRSGPRFRNLGVDPSLSLETVLCRRSVRLLLAEHGLTLDDVDRIALNGLPSRYRAHVDVLDVDVPMPTVSTGRVVAVPHHRCHAASAFRVSGMASAWIFTVDGRGDRETAALFRADDGEIRPVRTLLSLTDRSIGGVYETITRLLGFGSHGQGSVMALAAMGTPRFDLSPWLSARSWDDVSLHEQGVWEAFAHLQRAPDAPVEPAHADLAASLQAALEQTLLTLVRTGVDGPVDRLCLAGGVTLNCKANDLLRTELRVSEVFAQPGANDAGTALGAASEAWHRLVGTPLAPMTTAGLGPRFDDDTIERALQAAGVVYARVDDVADEVAARLADGQVVCWFQDRLEFGPRALGARSILSDPRRTELHGRVNRLKDREDWRPFGPSILAGHEGDWFVDAFDTRFMLFTQWVRPERRAEVPVIVHVDGSTRPQVVHADTHPLYHRMISAFHRRTGVPIVVDTSFNRRGEPIVARPEDALDAFAGLGADVLAIGSFLVRRGERVAVEPVPRPSDDAALAALPGGRRLMLRATTTCDLRCGHCTIGDHVALGAEMSTPDLLRALAEGRRTGCDELVLMRGEVTLRPDLVDLVRRARRMGYRFVQLQTHARRLADAGLLRALREAGVDALEVMLLGADAAVHDRIAGVDGAFRESAVAVQAAVRLGYDVLVTVPVLRRNAAHLPRVMALLHKVGVRRVQLSFPRPVETKDGVPTEELLRLAPASAAAARGARQAQKLGMSVSTEGFPLCRLETWLHTTPDATEDFGRHRIHDLTMVHDDFEAIRDRIRPEVAPCRGCRLAGHCPRTWGLYLEMFGSGELRTVS